MTEREPINGKEQIKLTTEPPTNRLNDRGDIFMAEGNGGGPEHGAPKPIEPQPIQPEQPTAENSAAPKGKGGRKSQKQTAGTSQPDQVPASNRQREIFRPSTEEQEVPEGVAIPPGATIRMDRKVGKSYARWDDPPDVEISYDKPAETNKSSSEQMSSPSTEALVEDYLRQLREVGITQTELLGHARKIAEDAINRGEMPPMMAPQAQPEIQPHESGHERQEQRGSSIRLYLEQRDIEMIETSPMTWLNSKFDMIYQFVDAGRELDSPQVSQLQQMFTMAANHISTYSKDLAREHGMTSEQIKEFNDAFNTRLNLIFLRSAIEHKNIDGVKQAAERLQSHGLFTALGMEGGKVSFMFSRMEAKLEDKRLTAEKGHVTPEMMSDLQGDVIKEQLEEAINGAGVYGKDYKDAREGGVVGASSQEASAFVESEIRRAVRTAYDAFVVTQRQAIIVARGHHLEGLHAFKSEPAALFNMFNLEDLLTEKFGMFGPQAHEFLDEMKLDIARSKLTKDRLSELNRLGPEARRKALLEYGTRMFRDLYAAPDFFSSSWRIDPILGKIRENIGERAGLKGDKLDERANDLGLFLRLKLDVNNRQRTWGRIAEIRPEEMLRLFRERAMNNPALGAQLGDFFAGSVFDGYRVNKIDGGTDGLKTYDKFKEEFGAVTQLLRQNGYKEMQALRIKDGFTPAEKDLIKRYFGDETKADQLQKMFAHFSEVASKDGTIQTLMSDKFEDIYTRTLLVDDALLDIIDRDSKTITPISKAWKSEVAQDPLVRNINDLDHFSKAASNLIGFIGTEDTEARLKLAITFAEETSAYNGVNGKSECIRYTVGTLLELSKMPIAWDALGIGKLPFRKAMTAIERIYGPQAQPMSRGDLRKDLDKYRSLLTIETYKEMEHLLSVTGEDTVKLRALSFLCYLIFAVGVESVAVLDINSLNKK